MTSTARRDADPAGDDRSLVESARHGDGEAFGRLVRRHGPDLLAFAERRCGSATAADDAVAVAFEKAWHSLDKLAGAGDRFRPWMYRIVANELSSWFRSERRRGEREVVAGRRGSSSAVAVGDPAEGVEVADDAAVLRRALTRLSEPHQEVISLRYLADLEPRDVANALGISKGAVAVRLHRAMAALRRQLEDDERRAEVDDPGRVTSEVRTRR